MSFVVADDSMAKTGDKNRAALPCLIKPFYRPKIEFILSTVLTKAAHYFKIDDDKPVCPKEEEESLTV